METNAHAKEETTTPPKRGKVRRILCVLGVILAVFVVAFFVYVNIYHHADSRALAAMKSGEGVTVE